MAHIPVLLKEVIAQLDPRSGAIVIDATAGEGGHVIELARRVAPQGGVVAIDRDAEALSRLKERVAHEHLEDVVTTVHGTFADVAEIAQEHRAAPADGILFDLGFSSWQLEESGRGFTFQRDEPLDMRFDTTDTTSPAARDVVNSSSVAELEYILHTYGEERHAARIAREIVRRRKHKKITTTTELVAIIEELIPRRGRLHPATKTFQALRIAVNDELLHIERGLQGARTILAPGGRIVVISFHSLEDRLVKTMFRSWEDNGFGTRINKKVITANFHEVRENPRSRSAKLRVFSAVPSLQHAL
jgi:16S rRNA (cytosine1402-N4)-methyltransferase